MMSNDSESSMVLVVGGSSPAEFLARFAEAAGELGFFRPGEAPRTNEAREVDNKGDYVKEPSHELPEAAAPKRRGRRSNAEIAAEKAEAEGVAAEAEATKSSLVDETVLVDEEQSAAKEWTIDDAKDAGRAVLAKGKIDDLRAILSKFAVTKVNDLKPPQFAGFVEACRAVAVS